MNPKDAGHFVILSAVCIVAAVANDFRVVQPLVPGVDY
jgi:hypothetical protein